MNKWDVLFHSLKDNWSGLKETEKKACLQTLSEAKEAMLDKWMEMDEKLDDLKQEIELVEKSQISYRSRGTSFFELNMFEEAIEEFHKEKSDCSKMFIELYLGFSQLYSEQFDQAKETFLFVIHMNPSKLETHLAYVGLGIIFEQQQYFEEAIPYFEKALELTPNADAIYNLGSCHLQLKAYHVALDYFKKYIRLDELDPEAYYYLGYCYMKLDQPTKAFEAWMTALQTGETKELLFTIAYEFEYHGFHLAAIHCLKRIRALGFHDSSVSHAIAWNYGLLEEKDKAQQMFLQLLKREPANINVMISYLWLLGAWGEDGAKQAIIRQMPKSALTHPLIQPLL